MTEAMQISRAATDPSTPGQSDTTSSQNKPATVPGAAVEPAVEIFEDATGITVLADMPGVPREGLDVRLDGDTLVIEGDVSIVTPHEMRGLWAELSVPRYRRAFTLGRELDGGRIEAGVKDGVLTLRIPKQAHAQPRRIAVSTA